MRLLVAFEDEYHVYADAITGAIRRARPTDEVVNVEVGVLTTELTCFVPHLIISSLPAPTDSGGWLSWMRLSLDPTRPSQMLAGENYRELLNPGLGELLSVIEETQELVESNCESSKGGR